MFLAATKRLAPGIIFPLVFLLIVALSTRVASAADSSGLNALWVAQSDGMLKVATADGTVLLELEHGRDVGAIAVDDRRGILWAYGDGALMGYSFAGQALVTVRIPDLAGDDGKNRQAALAVAAETGTVWLALHKDVYRIDPDGQLLGHSPLKDKVRAMTVDPDRSRAWVATKKALLAYDASGSRVAEIEWGESEKPRAIAFDRQLDAIWLATKGRLRRIDASGVVGFESSISGIEHLAVDGEQGVWVATKRSLMRVDASGLMRLALQPFADNPKQKIIDIVADPGDQSVWVANDTAVLHLDGEGQPQRALELDRTHAGAKIRALAIYSDTVAPSLHIAAPPAGAYVASRIPDLVFEYASLLAPVDPASLSVRLDGDPLPVECSHSTEGSVCVPAVALPEGALTLSATIADLHGNVSEQAEVYFTVDSVPPLITIETPAQGALTNQPVLRIAGHLSEPADLVIGETAVSLALHNQFEYTADLLEGVNAFELVATDLAGNIGRLELTVILDTVPPDPVSPEQVEATDGGDGTTTLQAGAGSAEPGAEIRVTNNRTGATDTAIVAQDGSFALTVATVPGDTVTVVVSDGAGNSSVDTQFVAPAGAPQEPLPPDPAQIAPPLDPTVPTTLFGATEFIYTGANPTQRGVAPGTIEARHAGVIRGRVTDRDLAALSGVRITIKDHSEFGYTLSRADGGFDLVVNGGGWLTVRYERDGYLPVQRQITVPWQDYVWLPDVVMIPLDHQVTTIDLGAAAAIQTARGSAVTDADGTRQATVLFPQGLQAQLILPDGSAQPLTTLNVRATEYTVGEHGPAAMPGELASTTGYTYAVELSVDEAIAAGAKEVRFDRPVSVYVENFLDFPIGGIVPSGWYDRDKAAWIPSDNGRIIQVLSVTDGHADLDVDGSGGPADAEALTELGITDAERRELATLYEQGQSMWRVPVEHFTPWDYNWPYGPPPDAAPPEIPAPYGDDKEEKSDCRNGSIIECQNQVLGQTLPIAGSAFTLNYRSDRVPGRKAAYTMSIPLSGPSLPDSLKRIELEISIAGRRFRQSLAALPNQTFTFTWDGKDAFGRTVQGVQDAAVRIGYVYPAVYYDARADFVHSFAVAGTAPISGDRQRLEITLWQKWVRPLGLQRATGMGAWSLDQHHVYGGGFTPVLYRGDGWERGSRDLRGIVDVVAGRGGSGLAQDGGQATETHLNSPRGIALGADGSLYIADRIQHIRRVTPDGTITTIAGNRIQGYSGDGGPATQASLNYPEDVALGTDGSVYIADSSNHRIRRVMPNGIITTYAGNGTRGYGGDGGPAVHAELYAPRSVVVAPDGSVYIAESGSRIRRVGPDGVISTVAGTGEPGYSGDGGPAIEARLHSPSGMTIAGDGSLYVADWGNATVRRVGPDGIIITVAGTGVWGYNGDYRPAADAQLASPNDVAIAQDGSVLIADWHNNRIRRVGSDGIITTIAGTGDYASGGDGGPASVAMVLYPMGLAMSADGSLYFADWSSRVRRIGSVTGKYRGGTLLVAAEDGSEYYVFGTDGRHLGTHDSVTGALRYYFEYDGRGLLTRIQDGDGNSTVIERDGGGNPSAIVAPDGQRTRLSLDAHGYLASVENPAGETYRMTYTPDGLLTQFTDPKSATSAYSYDRVGRLIESRNAAGGGWTIARSDAEREFEVSMTSAEGRTTRYKVERLLTEERLRTNLYADGTVSQIRIGTGGQREVISPDGTVTELQEGPDPRFGMQSPVTDRLEVATPGGRVLRANTRRDTDLLDSHDPLSHAHLDEVVTVNGRAFTRRYIAADRTYTLTTPEGRVQTSVLDDNGRIVREQVPGLEPINYGYDIRGRLTLLGQGGAGAIRETHFDYHPSGHQAGWLASITDPLQRSVYFEYDPAGRVTRQTLPDGQSIEYQYDAKGNLTALIPPGRSAHVFQYDVVDQEEAYTPPALQGGATVTRYQYNLDKQLTTVQRPDGTAVDLSYDAGGRLAQVAIGRGAYGYAYDGAGRLAALTAPDGSSLQYAYDGFLPLSETSAGTVSGTVTRDYNNDFRVTNISVNGQGIAFGYDADGLLTVAGALTVGRDPNDGLIAGTRLNTIATQQAYNPFGELSSVVATAQDTSLAEYAYARDALGRITGKSEVFADASLAESYSYDVAGRLISVTRNGITTTWGYDANGNRTHESGVAVATHDEQDRLLTYKGAAYEYTANGELRSKTEGGVTTQYIYDELGNLLQVTLPGDIAIEYVVDARNRRVGKKVNGELVQGLLYQDQLNPIAELDREGNVVARFVYADKPHIPAYMEKGGRTYRIISDHLGSPRLVVDTATGDVLQRMDYDAWGNVLLDSNPGFQPFGFAGGIYDQHTGLVRFGARDYDAQTGRWTTKDPIRFGGGDANLYGYVWDPVNFYDPEGLVLINAAGAGIGAGLGAVFGGLAGLISSGGDINAAINGAITGGIAGAVTGFSLGMSALGSAAVAGASDYINQRMNDPCGNNSTNWLSVANSAFIGATGAILGKTLSMGTVGQGALSTSQTAVVVGTVQGGMSAYVAVNR